MTCVCGDLTALRYGEGGREEEKALSNMFTFGQEIHFRGVARSFFGHVLTLFFTSNANAFGVVAAREVLLNTPAGKSSGGFVA